MSVQCFKIRHGDWRVESIYPYSAAWQNISISLLDIKTFSSNTLFS